MKNRKMSHIDDKGKIKMVDVGGKEDSFRFAVARANVSVSAELFAALKENSLAKGDALSAARIAGIMAAKKTSELIPLCHNVPLVDISVELKLVENPPSVEITTKASTQYKTGVEMEALTAASIAALTIYDMGKSIDRGMIIKSVELIKKSGGAGGEWKRGDSV